MSFVLCNDFSAHTDLQSLTQEATIQKLLSWEFLLVSRPAKSCCLFFRTLFESTYRELHGHQGVDATGCHDPKAPLAYFFMAAFIES